MAIFGPDALRAGVAVRDGRLTRATPAGPQDAFGARLAAAGACTGPLSVLTEDADLGLLEGFSGVLTGFTTAEEVAAAGPRGREVTSVAQALSEEEAPRPRSGPAPRAERPAISAVRRGKGMIVRVGLPEWSQRLARRDPAVTQLTYNMPTCCAASGRGPAAWASDPQDP